MNRQLCTICELNKLRETGAVFDRDTDTVVYSGQTYCLPHFCIISGHGPAEGSQTGPEAVLSLPMGENDAGVETVREYLVELLSVLWREQEGFSGKRPFGNSGWDGDLMRPLVKAGLINGTVETDEDGMEYGITDCDWDAGANLIRQAIKALL